MKFHFNLQGEHLNSSAWSYENGYIEGVLSLYIHDKLFFHDTHANVLELAMQLGNWLQKMENGESCDFVYDSLDSDDSALQFYIQKKQNSNSFAI